VTGHTRGYAGKPGGDAGAARGAEPARGSAGEGAGAACGAGTAGGVAARGVESGSPGDGDDVVPARGSAGNPGGTGGAGSGCTSAWGRTAAGVVPEVPAGDTVGSPIGVGAGLGSSSKKVKSVAMGGEVCSAKGKLDSSNIT
jgi:hypothetical protein